MQSKKITNEIKKFFIVKILFSLIILKKRNGIK